MDKKNISFRSYALLIMIALITFVLLYCFTFYYQKKQDYQNDMNMRMGFLSEIKESELSNYVMDNQDIIIYVSDSTDSHYEEFEQKLKDLILSEKLTKDIVYLDTHKLSNDFFEAWKKEMFETNVSMDTFIYPNVFVLRDGKVTSILYYTSQEPDPNGVIEFIKDALD